MSQKLSVAIPIYNESSNIEELTSRILNVFENLKDIEAEVVFVNDGSSDNSLELLQAKHAVDPRVKIVDLSRNFGHQEAIAAGLSCCCGDAVVIMDGDLQDPPELIPDLVAKWQEGNQVVRAVRKSRGEKGVKGFCIALFHKIFGIISDYKTPVDTGVFSLMDKVALDAFKALPEKNRYLPALRNWIGYRQADVEYDRPDRKHGTAKQSFLSLVKYASDALLSFSYKPLRLITLFGVLAAAIGFLVAFSFIMKRLLGFETAQTGFTTLVSLILFFGGVQLISLGVLGEYIARIYDEAKRRPAFIINNRIGFKD